MVVVRTDYDVGYVDDIAVVPEHAEECDESPFLPESVQVCRVPASRPFYNNPCVRAPGPYSPNFCRYRHNAAAISACGYSGLPILAKTSSLEIFM